MPRKNEVMKKTKLSERMKALSMSIKQLADKADLTGPTISRVMWREEGEIETITKIAQAVGSTIEELGLTAVRRGRPRNSSI